MSSDSIDRKLDAYARQPLPSAPPDLASGVWREIERRRHQTFASRIGWHELLARPGWTIAGLAFALAVGAVPAMVFAKAQQTKRLARQSLHFDVFSAQAIARVTSVLGAADGVQPHDLP